MTTVRKKTFDYVLVYQLDRFARNRYDSANYKAKLKKNGIRVLSAKENITEDASGILIEGVIKNMAEYYSAELSQKVRRGIRESLSKGYFIVGYKDDCVYIFYNTSSNTPTKVKLDKNDLTELREYRTNRKSTQFVPLGFNLGACGGLDETPTEHPLFSYENISYKITHE